MDQNLVQTFLRILKVEMLKIFKESEWMEDNAKILEPIVDNIFIFSLIWGLGGTVDNKGRESISD